jgi:hypothetical protein
MALLPYNFHVVALEVVRKNWRYGKALYGEHSWLHHVNRKVRGKALRVQGVYNPNIGN